MKLTDKEDSKSNRVILYGSPKSGKSLLAGKLAEAGFNLTFFDLENGYKTLRQLSPEAQSRINLVSLPDTRSYPIAIETMLKVIKGGEKKICQLHGKIDCALCKANAPTGFEIVNLSKLGPNDIVIVDSLTQLTNSAIAHITKAESDDYKLNYDDWGNLGKLLDIFLSHVQNAPFNIICISHETEVEMQDGNMKIVPTAGTRNFSRNTAKYFDHVIYCEVKNKSHKFGSATSYAMNIITGSRTGLELEKMKEASLVDIFRGKVVKESKEEVAQELIKPGPVEAVINKEPVVIPVVSTTSTVQPQPQSSVSPMADRLKRLRGTT